MVARELELPADPAAAVMLLRRASESAPVLLFKLSPICPTSYRAEDEYRRWLASLPATTELAVAELDVIRQRPLARGITGELNVTHESPQALWFEGRELRWHGSHGDLTEARFQELLVGGSAPSD